MEYEIKRMTEHKQIFKDHYARPLKTNGVITNISELLRSEETDAALCFCESEEKYRRRDVSDFEYFAELVRVLPMLVGTHVYDTVTTTICEICGDNGIIKNEFSDGDICELWKCCNEKISELCSGDVDVLCGKFGVEKSYYDEFAFYNGKCVGKCHNRDRDTTFVFDMKNIDFIRPDPYHYELANKKKNNGEKLNIQEISLVLSQELYLKLSEKSREKIQLHLRADDDGKNAEALINYIKGRNLSIEIFLAVTGEQSVERIASLCLSSDEHVRVRPEIVVSKTDSFANLRARLRLLFAVYPWKMISYGGSVTDSPAFFAEHLLFCRALESVLNEIR